MSLPVNPRTLRPTQRLGLLAWRTMMRTFGLLTGLRNRSLRERISEHAYGPHPSERIERIEPSGESPSKTPVVYVHGGGWICGNKEMYSGELLFLAEAGYPVFNVEYPLAPERPHPHMLLSLLASLAWIREQYPETQEVHLMGDSAGGNLASMLGILVSNPGLILALDPAVSLNLPEARSVVSIYGVLDRLSWIEEGFPGAALMMECYVGPEGLEAEIGPEIAVTPMDLEFEQLPPTFIGVGSKDQLAESSRLCAEHLAKNFEPVDYQVYPGEAHGFFNRSGRPACQALRRDILDFFAKH
ncbi:alpha/beta hydrolase [Myxococcota bacterium]|nr:alpha/beta hydrolase [Myxococcota bacterium]